MSKGRVAVSSVLAVVSACIGCYGHDWIAVSLSVTALILSLLSIRKSNPTFERGCFNASAVVMISTAVIYFLLPYSLVTDGMDIRLWAFGCGTLHAMVLPFLAMDCIYCIASYTGASFNWVMVAGFGFFFGMGLMMPGFVLEYIDVLYGSSELTTNAYALYNLLMSAVLMLISSIFARIVMKPRRLLITSNGVVVRER